MTVNELFRYGADFLKEHEIDDAEFDARCLLESALKIDTAKFFIIRGEVVSDEVSAKYRSLLLRRSNHEPLQYILGAWDFMSYSFYVGKGVLVPRPETEHLVELAVEYLKGKKSPAIIDLCSGSGCIAISLAKLLPEAQVYAVEKYDEAFGYLEKNINLNGVKNVTAIKGDLFDSTLLQNINADLIVSNPPYIRKNDINYLSDEVRNEPISALDGGADGYDFYRFLADFWLKEYLRKDSAIMVECAEDQGDYIATLFSEYSDKTEVVYDFNNLQRFVLAFK